MATAEEGSLNIVPVTTSQNNKINSFNGQITRIEKAAVGSLKFDAGGMSGTEVLTDAYTQNGLLDIQGALAGDLIIELEPLIQQSFWVRNRTTGGYSLTIQPTGYSGSVMPPERWILYTAVPTHFAQALIGWQDPANLAALAFAANYQVVSGRALSVYKNGADAGRDGGVIHLEGAVEETTSAPAAGDTIVTLPLHARPVHVVGFVVLADSATAALAEPVAIEIQTSGAVILRSLLNWTPLVNKPIDLSGISFFVGN